MKVLHAFKDVFPPTYGGVEQHVWDVTRSLGEEFESTVLTSSRSLGRTVEWLDGIRYIRAREFGRVLSTPITPSWFVDLRRTAADVVHVHLPSPMAEIAMAAARRAPPFVVSFHADIARSPAVARRYLAVRRRLLARADRIVVGSPVLADSSPVLAAHRDRVTVIPYGVDPHEWPADEQAVQRIYRAHGEAIVLFLGRLVAYKGVEVLIEAMRGVDATLLVVGDGPERAALEAEAGAGAGAGGRVRFIGNVSNENRSAYYQAASVFVLPAVSGAETFGIAMLEAMAQGTPAVSTDVGTGTSWVNRTGETGLVVPPRDPRALADAIKQLLADDALAKDLGEGAALRARRHFSKKAMLDGLASVYREVAAKTRA